MNKTTVEDYLIEDGIPIETSGFWYLVYSIMNYDDGMSIEKEVFPIVAEKFMTSSSAVGNSIRYLIRKSNRKKNRKIGTKKYIITAKMVCERKDLKE